MQSFDIIVVTVTLLSCLLACLRGFLKEAFSFAGWIFTTVATLYFFPMTYERLLSMGISSETVAKIVAGGGLFCAFFLFFLVLNICVFKLIELDENRIFDQTLGFAFGFFRSVALFSLGYVAAVTVVPEDNLPQWFTGALTYEPVRESGEYLLSTGLGDRLDALKIDVQKQDELYRTNKVEVIGEDNVGDAVFNTTFQ